MAGTIEDLESVAYGNHDRIRIVAARWKPKADVKPLKPSQPFDEFVRKATADLDLISRGRCGQDLLRKINERCLARGHTCRILRGKGTMASPKGDKIPGYAQIYVPSLYVGAPSTLSGVHEHRIRRGQFTRGVGAPAFACYVPDFNYGAALGDLIGAHTPSFVALAHELVHVLHMVGGTVWEAPDSIPGWQGTRMEAEDLVEEARTVGAGRYEARKISENRIRAEHRLPLRRFYAKAGDCDDDRLPSNAPGLPASETF